MQWAKQRLSRLKEAFVSFVNFHFLPRAHLPRTLGPF